MREHDKIDQSLGHDAAADLVMTLLVSRWPLDERVCARAALVPCLAWSFLDGVLAYYGRRGGIPVCRIGWTAD